MFVCRMHSTWRRAPSITPNNINTDLYVSLWWQYCTVPLGCPLVEWSSAGQLQRLFAFCLACLHTAWELTALPRH